MNDEQVLDWLEANAITIHLRVDGDYQVGYYDNVGMVAYGVGPFLREAVEDAKNNETQNHIYSEKWY